MDGCIQDIEKLKHDKKEQREIIEEQVDKIKSLNELELDLTSKLKNETDTRSSLMESKTDAITSLKEDIEIMSKESSDLKLLHEADRHSLEQSLEKDRGEKEDCLKQVNELKEKQSQNCDIINNMNDEKRRLQTDIEEKENEIKSLQIKLQLASRKVINVQVRHLSWFHAADVEKELQHILKTRMATEFIDLQFLTCPEAYLVHSDLPLFIVCSRRYTLKRDQNISIAIKGLKGTWKKAALLMFHDREWRALQNEVDSRIDDVKKIGEIFDIGHKSKIYVSDTNSRNIDGLIEFLKREGLQKSSDRESAI